MRPRWLLSRLWKNVPVWLILNPPLRYLVTPNHPFVAKILQVRPTAVVFRVSVFVLDAWLVAFKMQNTLLTVFRITNWIDAYIGFLNGFFSLHAFFYRSLDLPCCVSSNSRVVLFKEANRTSQWVVWRLDGALGLRLEVWVQEQLHCMPYLEFVICRIFLLQYSSCNVIFLWVTYVFSLFLVLLFVPSR